MLYTTFGVIYNTDFYFCKLVFSHSQIVMVLGNHLIKIFNYKRSYQILGHQALVQEYSVQREATEQRFAIQFQHPAINGNRFGRI